MRVPSLLLAVVPVAAALSLVAGQQTPIGAAHVGASDPSPAPAAAPASLSPEQAAAALAHGCGQTRHTFLPAALDDAFDGAERWAYLLWDEVKAAAAGLADGAGAPSGDDEREALVGQAIQEDKSAVLGASQLGRRQVAQAAPKIGSGPVFSVDQCFTSVDACANATDACSGRGECVGTKRAGKTCFSCECGTTVESDGETQWAGARCEKKDISSSFALILFTLVLLLFVAGGSIALLSSAGSEPLPSVLAAGGGAAPKRD